MNTDDTPTEGSHAQNASEAGSAADTGGTSHSGSDSRARHTGPFTRAVLAAAHAPATIADMAEAATGAFEQARANRAVITDLVRIETERAVAALGLVTPSDVMALLKRISDLERRIDTLERAAAAGPEATAESRASTLHARDAAAPKLGTPKLATPKLGTPKLDTPKLGEPPVRTESTGERADSSPAAETPETA